MVVVSPQIKVLKVFKILLVDKYWLAVEWAVYGIVRLMQILCFCSKLRLGSHDIRL